MAAADAWQPLNVSSCCSFTSGDFGGDASLLRAVVVQGWDPRRGCASVFSLGGGGLCIAVYNWDGNCS